MAARLETQLAAYPRTACKCDDCKSLCVMGPCSPTPAEAERFIDAGLAGALEQDGQRLAIRTQPNGHTCLFLTEGGLCAIHATLKPEQARRVDHVPLLSHRGSPVDIVHRMWRRREGHSAIQRWKATQ
jgi:hypothetical protein